MVITMAKLRMAHASRLGQNQTEKQTENPIEIREPNGVMNRDPKREPNREPNRKTNRETNGELNNELTTKWKTKQRIN